MNSREVRVVDQRVRMAFRGRETHRVVVVVTSGPTCTVRLHGALLTALVAGQTVRQGSVVEVTRPRGVGGQLQLGAVLRY